MAADGARRRSGQAFKVGRQLRFAATGGGQSGAANDVFGTSVAISGDTVVVGASGDDFGANTDQGSAYIFERVGTTWTQRQQLVDNSGADVDSLRQKRRRQRR